MLLKCANIIVLEKYIYISPSGRFSEKIYFYKKK